MRLSVAVLVFASAISTAALRFHPVDWSSYSRILDKRDASATDLDPETVRLLTGFYQKMQNDYQFQSDLKRRLWPVFPVSRANPDTLNEQEVAALAAGGMEKKNGDRNIRNYKNCFLSPVQCVMKGRA